MGENSVRRVGCSFILIWGFFWFGIDFGWVRVLNWGSDFGIWIDFCGVLEYRY